MPEAVAHPTPQQLSAFGLGKLPEDAAAAVARHLESCPRCLQLAAQASADSFLDKVRAARPMSPDTHLPPPLPGRATLPPALPAVGLPPELANHPKFEIVRELGRGGMGVIYLAQHRVMNKPVALKVISRAVLSHPNALARFRAEVQAAGQLDHPNIARAHDADQADGLHFLVLEFVEGMTLAQLVAQQGPLPVAAACRYIHQAALGLQHAFEQGMTHRDVKPQNLMVTPQGQVKVLDFGLARLGSEQRGAGRLTQVGAFMGTPEYMAPEQATDPRTADTRADVYSLGCTLYFLLAGRSPFGEGGAAELLVAHLRQEPAPLHSLCPQVPSGLSAVVARMLAKDPAQRFQTPIEVARALAPFVRPAAKAGTIGDPAPALAVGSADNERRIDADSSRLKKVVRGVPRKAPPTEMPARDTASPLVTLADTSARPRQATWSVGAQALGITLAMTAVLLGIVLWASGVLRGPNKTLGNLEKQAESEVLFEPAKVKPKELPKAAPRPPQDTGKSKPIAEEPDNWVPLFNGKDKSGWKTWPEWERDWLVEGGVLTWTGQDSCSLLCTRRNDFRDFRLRMETRISQGQYAQVIVRHPFGQSSKIDDGYRAVLGSTNDNPIETGSLSFFRGNILPNISRPRVLPGQWFTLEVTAEGNRVVIKVNGRTTADYLDNQQNFARGHITLFAGSGVNGGQRRLQFRKIEIKELNPKAERPRTERDLSAIRLFQGHEARVKQVLFSRDGSFLVSASNAYRYWFEGGRYCIRPGGDNSVRVWSTVSGQPIRELPVSDSSGFGVQGIALSPDARLAAACTSPDWGGAQQNQRLYVWDVTTGTRKHLLTPSGDRAMRAVGFSPDGATLFALRSGTGVHSYSLADGKERTRIDLDYPHPNEAPHCAAFSTDGHYVLGAGWAKPVFLWDRETGRKVATLEGHEKLPLAVALSPDGSKVLSCAGEPSVRLWDLKTGQQVWCLNDLESAVLCLAFSPDGKRFLTGEVSGAVRLRDTSTGNEVARLLGHAAQVNCVAFSPAGGQAASGSDDLTVRLWQLPAGEGK
jgi:serine/threonine protein kinase/WD40 repeat protein